MWNWNDPEQGSGPPCNPLLIAPMWNWNWEGAVEQSNNDNLLIAPMWNWNTIVSNLVCFAGVAVNRTNVELKFNSQDGKFLLIKAVNRTNVELKSYDKAVGYVQQALLIAPMWNWNIVTEMRLFPATKLLIAPMWNWNKWENSLKLGIDCC